MSIAEPAPTLLQQPDAPPRRRRGASRAGTPMRGLLPLIAALVVWQLLGDPASPYCPPPSSWVRALRPLLADGVLLRAPGWTSLPFVLGLVLATVPGAVVGASRRLDRAFGLTFRSLRVLPAASLVPLAALVLGDTIQMKLVVVLLPAMWPVLLSVRATRRSVSPVLMDVSRTLGLTGRDRLRKILVPVLTPSVLLGIRVSAPLALIITLLVEIVTKINGRGALLGTAQSAFLSDQVYGLLVIAGAPGCLVNWAVTRGEAVVSPR